MNGTIDMRGSATISKLMEVLTEARWSGALSPGEHQWILKNVVRVAIEQLHAHPTGHFMRVQNPARGLRSLASPR
ncbi:MAG TPA: hypothetical protein VFL04_05025 [Rectinemataceae bacterium]|nr:hypothetical protein [Rectinemataceae bacterium]